MNPWEKDKEEIKDELYEKRQKEIKHLKLKEFLKKGHNPKVKSQ